MGYYIATDQAFNKADYLVKEHEAKIVSPIDALDAMTNPELGVVCVVRNPTFEAAAYIYDKDEFVRFLPYPEDMRPRTYLVMAKKEAETISGYRNEP